MRTLHHHPSARRLTSPVLRRDRVNKKRQKLYLCQIRWGLSSCEPSIGPLPREEALRLFISAPHMKLKLLTRKQLAKKDWRFPLTRDGDRLLKTYICHYESNTRNDMSDEQRRDSWRRQNIPASEQEDDND